LRRQEFGVVVGGGHREGVLVVVGQFDDSGVPGDLVEGVCAVGPDGAGERRRLKLGAEVTILCASRSG
jgi:hypothetical protein